MKLVSAPGLTEVIGEFVSRRIAENGEIEFSGNYSAIGVVEGNEIIAGAVYHNWTPSYGTICMSIAATTPRWASHRTISGLLAYPFNELAVQRLTVTVNASNFASLRLTEGVGFTREARLVRAAGPDSDIIVFRLFAEDWRAGKFYKAKENVIFETFGAQAA